MLSDMLILNVFLHLPAEMDHTHTVNPGIYYVNSIAFQTHLAGQQELQKLTTLSVKRKEGVPDFFILFCTKIFKSKVKIRKVWFNLQNLFSF